jgi:glycosyltransferase involved in cell wall biosynthesis
MTDPLGQSQVIPYLKELSKNGFEIHILSAEKKNNFIKNKAQIASYLENNNITWHPIYYTKKPPILSTLIDIKQIVKKAIQLHRKHQFSICHCRSYISAFAGLKLKTKFNVPFLFDIRGFYADERVDGNLWNRKNIIYNLVYLFFKKKEKKFLSNADHIISLTETGKKVMFEWPYLNPSKNTISVIPCCADLDHFNPANINSELQKQLRKELDITSKDFILSYLGSIGTWYLLDEMLDFLKFY